MPRARLPRRVERGREVEAGKPLTQTAREHHLYPNLVRTWRTRCGERGASALGAGLPPTRRVRADARRAPHHSLGGCLTRGVRTSVLYVLYVPYVRYVLRMLCVC